MNFRVDLKQQLQAFFLGLVGDQTGERVHHLGQAETRLLQAQFAGFYFGKVENVVNDAQQGNRRRVHFLKVVLLPGRFARFQGQLAHADDGIHGRADFVAHVRQKCAFGLIRLDCLIPQPSKLGVRQLQLGFHLFAPTDLPCHLYRAGRQLVIHAHDGVNEHACRSSHFMVGHFLGAFE